MRVGRAAAIVALLASALAPDFGRGQGLGQVETMLDVIDHYVDARGLERACPDWRLDRGKTGAALARYGLRERNFNPPGFLYRKAASATERALSLGRQAACAEASSEFGPHGWIESNWMARR